MSTQPRLPRLPYVLLGAMSVVSFGGPFLIVGALIGGPSGKWPPDRPIEWVALYAVVGLAAVLFLACVSLSYWYRPPVQTKEPDSYIRSPEQSIT